MNENNTTTKPANPATPCSPSSRAVVCCYCGKAWNYDGKSPKESLVKEAVEHETTCDKNPYTARIKKLEIALLEIAKQKLAIEMDDHSSEHADYEGGYEAIVNVARAALSQE